MARNITDGDVAEILTCVHGGPPIFVSTDGNDSNDGTTWANRKATFSAANSVVSAKNLLKLAPGTYDEGAPVTLVSGALYKGAGMGRSVITSSTDVNVEPLLKLPAAGSYPVVLEDLSVNIVKVGSRDNLFCLGILNTNTTLDLICRRVQLRGHEGPFILYTTSTSASTAKFYDCVIEGTENLIQVVQGSISLQFYNCIFRRTLKNEPDGLGSIFFQLLMQVSTNRVLITCVNCTFELDSNENDSTVVDCSTSVTGTAQVVLVNCAFNTVEESGATSLLHINATNGIVHVYGGTVDRSKCIGIIGTELIFHDDVVFDAAKSDHNTAGSIGAAIGAGGGGGGSTVNIDVRSDSIVVQDG